MTVLLLLTMNTCNCSKEFFCVKRIKEKKNEIQSQLFN